MDVTETAHSLVGKRIGGRYTLDSLTQVATYGAAYRATSADGQALRIKLSFLDQLPEARRASLQRAADNLVELSHPHLFGASDAAIDEAEHVHYLAFPEPLGLPLSLHLERVGRLTPSGALTVLLQAARGLMALHRVQVIHGHLELCHLFLEAVDDEISIKVANHDLGPLYGERCFPEPASATEESAPPTPSADVFGLGKIGYLLLSGVEPRFVEGNGVPGEAEHLQDRAAWVSPGVVVAVHRALKSRAHERFPSVEAFANALYNFSLGDEPLNFKRLLSPGPELVSQVAERADLDRSVESYVPLGDRDDPEALVGNKLDGRYLVKRLIGSGGMGAVYEVTAEDGTRRAAKVISRSAQSSASAMRRFAREARAASVLESVNVVRTYEAGTDERLLVPYILMELMQGLDWSSLHRSVGALRPEVVVRLALQACAGLGEAHRKGIVHRDVKLANLFLQIDPQTKIVTLKVCDFGVVKQTQVDSYSMSSAALTRTGRMLGSPMYMSPEQARSAKHVDVRTDVWSLSVVLWEALSGQRLWAEYKTLGDLVVAICSEDVKSLEEVAPWVPKPLARVVHKGLERDREKRWPSVEALAAALEVFTGGTWSVRESDLEAVPNSVREAAPVSASRSEAGPGGRSKRPAKTGQRSLMWGALILVVLLLSALTLLL